MSPRVNVAEWYEEAMLARYCRTCGARKGDLCRSGTGHVVKPHGARMRNESAVRPAAKGVPRPTRLALIRRSGGWCEVCPVLDEHAERHAGEDPHHRRMRSQGGTDDLDNLLWTCRRIHRLLHDHGPTTRRAYETGCLLRTTATVQE